MHEFKNVLRSRANRFWVATLSAVFWVLASVAIVGSIGFMTCHGCDTGGDAERVLEEAGFRSISIIGPDPWACGRHDGTYSDTFTAIGPGDRYVEGVVCCGVLSGCTIHYKGH